MRLYVLVEGQTEEEFVKSVLVPHLWRRRIEVRVSVVETSRDAFGRKRRGGGRRWGKWYCDLKRLTTEQHGGDVRFTTMFDLYGLPKDFPVVRARLRQRHISACDTPGGNHGSSRRRLAFGALLAAT